VSQPESYWKGVVLIDSHNWIDILDEPRIFLV
jgi:hypothetical protein